MPELPDVEGYRLLLESRVPGQRVTAVEIRDAGVVRAPTSEQFARQLTGQRFRHPARRGKWLLAPTDELVLLVHFGMTGSLRWVGLDGELSGFDRVAIVLERGKLVFRDQRKLGGLWLARSDTRRDEIIGEQGPDALGLSGRRLRERLETRRGALKTAMMDQSVLAGIGNTLSDEVLWQARIHPSARFQDLDDQDRHDLDLALQRVLRSSVKHRAIPRRPTWLSSQRAQPEPRCPRCHERLVTSRIGGRTSYWCPVCQPLAREETRN